MKADAVMALVEIQAGPYLLAAAITSDAVEELALAPGVKEGRVPPCNAV